MSKKQFLILFFCMISIYFHSLAYAIDLNKRFTHYAENQDISDALNALAKSQNMTAFISENVEGILSGNFQNVRTKDFLDSMRLAFGVEYYTQADTINFYNEQDIERSFISVQSMEAERVIELLEESGIVSEHLQPRVISDSNNILVEGPDLYIQQITAAIQAFEIAQTSNQVMKVFPLKHAWAQDITVSSAGSQIVLPGIASILQAMVSGAPLPTQVTAIPNSVTPVASVQDSASSLNMFGMSLGTSSGGAEQAGAGSNTNVTQANIIADPRMNAVLITDAAYRMDYYAEVIADLDKPVELVEIHAAIVDIDSDYNRDVGINFDFTGTSGDFSGTGGVGSAPVLTDGLSFSTIYQNGLDMFLAQVEMLETQNEARVLGKPSVLTMDNLQATLENTSTYYIELIAPESVDLFKVDSGTVLKVTPHIIPSDDENEPASIKLVVHVQDNQGDSSGTPTVGALPPIKQTIINTQAVVKEGQSLLIGGYYYEQSREVENGVPYLMRIPLIGNLFKRSTIQTQKMERLIMITPRIVNDNNVNPHLHAPEKINSDEFKRIETLAKHDTPKPGCSKSPSPEQ